MRAFTVLIPLILRTWMLMEPCSSVRAEEAGVTFIPPAAPSGEVKKVAEVEMFNDQPAQLAWRIMALPGSKIALRGQVFQAASSLTVPLKDLAFEAKTAVAEGRVQGEVQHSLALPETGRPAIFLIKWQALNGETPLATGTVRLRLSPRGLLTPLQNVSFVAEGDWKPWIRLFEQDQVKVVQLQQAELTPEWQGVLFTRAGPALLEKIKSQPLQPGQSLVVFGDLPGMPGTIFAKHSGRGRLMILPTAHLAAFPSNPALQRLVVEFCQSLSPETPTASP